MVKTDSEIGRRLRRKAAILCAVNGLDEGEMLRRAGVSRKLYTSSLRSDSGPRIGELARLAGALGCDIYDLIHDEEGLIGT